MTETSAHGKHLFLHFDDDIVHIHLGLYGWFKLRKNKQQQPGNATRLRIMNDEYLSDLAGPTACEIVDYDWMLAKKAKLGPDPIHEDADPESAWAKISKSKKTIGGLLMDQSVIAGIGNVYRAELLFLARLSPFIAGRDVPKEKFDEIWKDSVRLLRLGAEDGHIRTVSEDHLVKHGVELHGCTQYSYVYKRTGDSCLVCDSRVASTQLDGRTVYWCEGCQK
jgi:endonuclease-8